VHSIIFRVLPFALALSLLSFPARGQYTRDEAANKKIRQAIDVHYLATEFEKAEAVLTGTIAACAEKCSPQLLAKAWMYVGIVRGSALNNMAGAKEAFAKAKALDPKVKLDAELATPEAQKTFAEVAGAAEAAAPESAPETAAAAPKETAAPEGEAVALECTPSVMEVETRRRIPVECKVDLEGGSLELRFKPAGEEWQSLAMNRQGESFRAEIPCDKTAVSGTFRLFVRVKDKSGDEVAAWGNKANPIQIALVESSAQEPPAFDGASAPQRCEAKEDCPPNFPGCNEKAAQACSDDSDCSSGVCFDGKCTGDAAQGNGYRKNWIGLHVAQDLTFIGGTDICTQASQNDDSFACYYAGSRSGAYVDDPYPGTDTSSSLVFATTRVLLSYDRALSPHWLAGVRVGYAFGGGPPSGRDVVYDTEGRITEVVDEGLAFLPIHVEARVSHWFGAGVLSKTGIRPYVHAGGGLAQVDAKVETPVRDCGLFAPRESAEYAACASGQIPSSEPGLQEVKLDAWKKLGQGFITAGGGAVYAFTERFGLQLNLNLMLTVPVTGIVVEPSLGAVMGF
jgi:hypothetical protein